MGERGKEGGRGGREWDGEGVGSRGYRDGREGEERRGRERSHSEDRV